MNMSKVKYTKGEESIFMDNSKIEAIKAQGYFKLFECGKKIFYNLDATYGRACVPNAKDKYWGEMCDNITKNNDQNHTPLSNVKIREVIDQVMRKEEEETNNFTVDTFSLQRNESENLINVIENLTINDFGNNIIKNSQI